MYPCNSPASEGSKNILYLKKKLWFFTNVRCPPNTLENFSECFTLRVKLKAMSFYCNKGSCEADLIMVKT